MSAAIAPTSPDAPRFLRWRLAIPPEKGGWIWWLGPCIAGFVAAGGFPPAAVWVLIGAFAAFCIRQPLTLIARQARRTQSPRHEPALFWAAIYATILLATAIALGILGHGRVVVLALLAVPAFAWNLALVYRGRDRHHAALDLAAAASLSLAGPAAYWAAGGESFAAAFWVWALSAAQSGASIVHMLLRLEQRVLPAPPPMRRRLAAGTLPALAHSAALGLAFAAFAAGQVAIGAVLALLLPALEGGWSILHPQVRHTPKQLGFRQLAVSCAAMLLLAFGLRPPA